MSKGSGRRPQQADEKQVADNWAAIFGKGKPEPEPPAEPETDKEG
jgi:hypothetical protein